MNNANEPINPMPHQNQDGTIQHDVYFGLTKREYFAGLAMQAIISSNINYCGAERFKETPVGEAMVIVATEFADDLLKELENDTSTNI